MDWDENRVIERIQSRFPTRPELTPCGIGDDCALIGTGNAGVLLTTDASVENIHFNLEWMSAGDAAYRCMTSNISDVAAMGGEAGAFSLALGLPATLLFEQVEDIVEAFYQCISDHGLKKCWLVGGDVVRSPSLFFSVTVLADRPTWPIVRRDGASSGDLIVVIGDVGRSAVGLDLLSRHFHDDDVIHDETCTPFIHAFRRPKAQALLGPLIARHGLASAMMDLSDGIMTDLPRLLAQSHCGGKVNLDALVPDCDMDRVARKLGCDPIDWMLCGGEDFGLLLTVHGENLNQVMELADSHHERCLVIGSCIKGEGIHFLHNNETIHRNDCSFRHF